MAHGVDLAHHGDRVGGVGDQADVDLRVHGLAPQRAPDGCGGVDYRQASHANPPGERNHHRAVGADRLAGEALGLGRVRFAGVAVRREDDEAARSENRHRQHVAHANPIVGRRAAGPHEPGQGWGRDRRHFLRDLIVEVHKLVARPLRRSTSLAKGPGGRTGSCGKEEHAPKASTGRRRSQECAPGLSDRKVVGNQDRVMSIVWRRGGAPGRPFAANRAPAGSQQPTPIVCVRPRKTGLCRRRRRGRPTGLLEGRLSHENPELIYCRQSDHQ